MVEVCGNCKFYHKRRDACRRFPPTVVMDGFGSSATVTPRVEVADWCGEWKKYNRDRDGGQSG